MALSIISPGEWRSWGPLDASVDKLSGTPDVIPGNSAALPVGVVVIGRNEGERLRQCLGSVRAARHVVYVDSGSTDGSCALARSLGCKVVELTSPPGFSAARARNAGLAQLQLQAPNLGFVQFVDGDCTVAPGWLETALAQLEAQPETAIVFGRRRELYPHANAYHRACDREWAVPAGLVPACGGDILARITALRSVGAYNPELIAGEEPDLCLRLRRRGWTIRCIAAEMTTHDVAIGTFAQWWRRSRRAGFATTRLVQLHGLSAEPGWRRYLFSTVLWTALMASIPAGLVLAALAPTRATAAAAVLPALAVCIQWLRLARRNPAARRHPLHALADGGLVLVTKVASFAGMAEFAIRQASRRRDRLIEYKGTPAS